PLYSGDTRFNVRAGAVFAQTIANVAAPTTTTLSSSLNPAQIGQGVTFTATVSGTSPTGSVDFKDGSALLATVSMTGNQASYTTSSLTAGSHSITASYSGDSTNGSSTSTILYQSVFSPQAGAALLGIVRDRVTSAPIPGVGVNAGCSSCAPAT